MAGAPIASLSDDFENNIIDPAWISGPSGSGTVTESGGQARCALPSSTAGSHSAYYRSAGTYDLTGDGFYIDIATMVNTGVVASMTFDAFSDSSNIYRWAQSNGTLTARKIVAGVNTSLYSVAWNASTFRYLRIRESAGTVFFDSSSDGSSWTNRATQTVAGAFAVTDLTVQFGASCGNVASPGTLVLNDVNLLSLATNWRWIEVRREYNYRLGGITLAATSGVGYIATAASIDSSGNLVSPRYFAGPQASGRALVEYSSQAAAEVMAVALPTLGRWDMPAGVYVEARYVRLSFRSSTGSSFTIREYYPRRLVQADDIEAESIRAIHIAAASITADKLSVLQLSAITADMGSITAGTITGATIQTATSGARIELTSANGLRSFNSGSTLQVQIRTSDGALTWGAGNGVLDANGLTITGNTSSTYSQPKAITLKMPSNAVASLMAYEAASSSSVLLENINAGGSNDSRIILSCRAAPGSPSSAITLFAPNNPAGTATIDLNGKVTGIDSSGQILCDVGAQIATNSAIGTTINSGIMLLVRGQGTTSGTYAATFKDGAGADIVYLRNDKQAWVNQAWTVGSDKRNKKAIAALDVPDTQIDALLSAFKPSRYRLDGDADDAPEHFGFIAQEWKKHPLLATLVRDASDGKLGIQYDGAIPILALLLQRAFARITQLEARAA